MDFQRSSGAWRRTALAVAFGGAGCLFSAWAAASCGQAPTPGPERDLAPWAAGLTPALYRPGDAPAQVRVVDLGDLLPAGIVGLWRFKFISDGTAYPAQIPYGALVDFGTTQWHSDGTEFMISGGRAPSTGDVCMGVWEQTGHHTYKMRHIALGWVGPDSMPPAAKPAYGGPSILTEKVTLSDKGDTFTGSFTIDVYATDETTLLQHIGGSITATRFKVEGP